jgi:hypothetical protein
MQLLLIQTIWRKHDRELTNRKTVCSRQTVAGNPVHRALLKAEKPD